MDEFKRGEDSIFKVAANLVERKMVKIDEEKAKTAEELGGAQEGISQMRKPDKIQR